MVRPGVGRLSRRPYFLLIEDFKVRYFAFILVFFLALGPVYAQPLALENTTGASETVGQALEAEQHTRFLKFLKDASLEDFLTRTQITLLVPDEAFFESLSDEDYQLLTSDPEVAREALNFHCLQGEFLAKQLAEGGVVMTLSGEEAVVENDEEFGLLVNGLQILRSDMVGPGFVIHVVDNFVIGSDSGDDMTE